MISYKVKTFLCLFIVSILSDLSYGDSEPCFGLGYGCVSAPENCCDGLTCDEDVCIREHPTTTSTTYPTCQKQDQKCDYSEECCRGLICLEGHCKVCLRINADCKGKEKSCCRESQCVEDPFSNLVCTACKEEDHECEKDEQCCEGLLCHKGYCTSTTTSTPDYCLSQGTECAGKENSCCSGLECIENKFNIYICDNE